jgi:NDP-sugar pyrophosphorylase family protein
MQAVLMAGGKGTRLRPFTAVLPKPLVPIGDFSILEIVLRQLKHYGFREIIISVGHKAELIMAVVGDGGRFGLKVRYYQEEKPLGTVGALARMEDLDDNFLVMNGDICTNLDFMSLYSDHLRHRAPATIGSYRRHERIELGVLELDNEKTNIIGFREKPSFDFWVSMGVNAFHKSILDLIPADEYFGFDDLMHGMLENRFKIRIFPFDGLWLDIGRPDDYEQILKEFDNNRLAYLPDEIEPQ